MRAGPRFPYALDYTAVLLMAEAMGAMSPLLADVLPRIEQLVVNAYRREGDADAG